MVGVGGMRAASASSRVHELLVSDAAAQVHSYPRRRHLGIGCLDGEQLMGRLGEVEPMVATDVKGHAMLQDRSPSVELLARLDNHALLLLIAQWQTLLSFLTFRPRRP